MFANMIRRHYPSDWTPMNLEPPNDYELVKISEHTTQYRLLADKAVNFLITGKTGKIVRVQNPYLYGQFLLKKEEYETRGRTKVLELFHDTAQAKIPSIVTGNLDWRNVKFAKYGQGVYFSPVPRFANSKSNYIDGKLRAMIIADVLIGTYEWTNATKPLPEYGDTSVGNRKQVYVKYYDNEFYPKYIVFYENW